MTRKVTDLGEKPLSPIALLQAPGGFARPRGSFLPGTGETWAKKFRSIMSLQVPAWSIAANILRTAGSVN